MIKQTVAKILDSEMDRKDFLKLVALGAVASVGTTHILKAVSSSQPRTTAKPNNYGISSYGGKLQKK